MSYWIAPSLAKTTSKNINIENVIYYICKLYNVTYDDVKSKSREFEIVRARHLTAYVLHRIIGIGQVKTGKYIHRDHSSVCTSCKEVSKFLEFDIELKSKLEEVIDNNYILLINKKSEKLCKKN